MNWKKILKGINTVADAGNAFNNMAKAPAPQQSTWDKVMSWANDTPKQNGDTGIVGRNGTVGQFVVRAVGNYMNTTNQEQQARKNSLKTPNAFSQMKNEDVVRHDTDALIVARNNPDKKELTQPMLEAKAQEMSKKKEDNKKWYQKLLKTPEAFKNGYQIGDISQTIGQTTLDIGGSIIGGIESAGQGLGNVVAGIASPFVAQAYADRGGDYSTGLKAWEKAIGQEHSVYDKYVDPNIRKDSVLGQTSESALEGIGYTLASAEIGSAMGGGNFKVGKLNMPIFSFISGAGNSLQEGFSKDDYNRAMVWMNAGGEGAIESFTEGVFGLFGVGGNEITDTLKANVMKKCSTGLGKAIANVGLSGAGEGAEEVLGYIMTYGLHNFEAYAERQLGLGDGSNWEEAFDSEEMWESFWSSMISTVISAGMAEYAKTDMRTAQTLNNLEQQLGRELSDDEVKAVSKEVLKQVERDVEQELLGEGIINDIQTNEKLSQDQKEFLMEQRILNLWTDDETKNEINEIIKINENIAKNQPATMQNEAISEKEQQTISNEQKEAQNVTSNDIEQNAKNTLQNNVILEKKNGKQVYKERNTVEIDENDTLESSYKKYFGDNETSLFKNLKNIEKVAKDIATNVVYDANLFKDKDGSINTKAEALFRTNNGQREIVVNPYADTGKAFERIVAHELTHSVLGNNTKEAKQLMQTVENFWKNKYGQKGYNNIVSELREAYGENYNEEEVTAKTIEQLFTTEEALDELANSNPNIFTRIYRSLVGMYAKLTGNEKAYLKKLKLDMELAWDKSRNKEKLQDAVGKYSFGGLNAKTANIGTLEEAKKLKEQGLSNEEIFKQTGWFEGNEGKWRFEIDNSKANLSATLSNNNYETRQAREKISQLNDRLEKLNKEFTDNMFGDADKLDEIEDKIKKVKQDIKKQQNILNTDTLAFDMESYVKNSYDYLRFYKLNEILNNDDLFEAYPQLKDIEVQLPMLYRDYPKGLQAYVESTYDPNTKTIEPPKVIYLTKEGMSNKTELRKTLLHEIQHIIQNYEGFSSGSNQQVWYDKLTNEEMKKIGNLSKNYISSVLEKKGNAYLDMAKNQMKQLTNGIYELNKMKNANEEMATKIASEKGWNNSKTYINSLNEQISNAIDNLKYLGNEKYVDKFVKSLNKVAEAGKKSFGLYLNTAGEIEAREVEKRADLLPRERSRELPFIKDKNTVYSETMSKQPAKLSQETSVDKDLELSNTDSQGRKQQQLEIIQENNPKDETLSDHTWITSINDINTFEEALQNDDYENQDLTPDFTNEDVQKALDTGKITVYSSKPIEQGIFVTPSKMEAQNYAGNGQVYSQEVNLSDVAWIDSLQGQYAKVEQTTTQDSQGRELTKEQQEYFKDSKVRDENGNLIPVYHGTEANIDIPKEHWFTIFDERSQGLHGSMFGDGFYFTTNKQSAQDNYAHSRGNVYETYLNITNPYNPFEDPNIPDGLTYYDCLRFNFPELSNYKGRIPGDIISNTLKNHGYDGIKLDDDYIAFYSNQIKNVDNTNPTTDPDIRYSVETEEFDRILSENFPEPATTDNNGKKLNQKQQDFFKNSKARSLEDGGLVNVFHTTTGTTPQFNEFNPVGTPGYKFGNQVVNYFTDNKEMSGSYANQKYEMANTQKLQSMSDVDNFIDSINSNSKSGNEYFISENDGKYTLILTDSEIGENVSEFFKNLSEEEKQELKDNIYHDTDFVGTPYEYAFSWDKFSPELQKKYNDLMDKYIGNEKLVDAEKRLYEIVTGQQANNEIATYDSQEELFKHLQEDLQKNNWTDNTKIQYSGYVNIQNPYVVDAKGRNWNLVDYESNEELDEVINTINTISDDTYNSIIDIYNNEIGKVNNAERKVNEMQSFISTHKDSKFIDEISKITILETIDQSKALKKNKDLTEENTTFSSQETIKRIAGTEDLSKALEYINKKLKEDSGYNGLTIGQFIEEQRDAITMSRSKYGSAGNFDESLEAFFENNPEEQERFQYLDSEMGYDGNFNELLSNVLHDGISGEELKQTLETYFIKNLSESSTETNDIVKQVIDYNNSLFEDYNDNNELAERYGLSKEETYKNRTPEEILTVGGYDGVIIRNTVDYGGKAKNRSPHDLYITFGSEQFKAEDNLDPTGDKDIRYSKDTTGDWENYLTKYAKEGTQTFLPGLKGVMPEKKYSIKDYEDVLKEYQFTDKDKQDLLADLEGIELNRQSLNDFKDFVKQYDEAYQESRGLKDYSTSELHNLSMDNYNEMKSKGYVDDEIVNGADRTFLTDKGKKSKEGQELWNKHKQIQDEFRRRNQEYSYQKLSEETKVPEEKLQKQTNQLYNNYMSFRELSNKVKSGKISDEEFFKETYSDKFKNTLKLLGFSKEDVDNIWGGLADFDTSKVTPEIMNQILKLYNFKSNFAREDYRNQIIAEREKSKIAKETENNILNTNQTFSTGRKEIYNKYRNDNSNYDKTFINQAKQAVPGNRYGRTKDQWLYVAKTLGNYMANANLTDEQIEKITYRTWLDEAPNQKSNLNRQGEKFVKFNSDDWINAVYNEVNNLRKFSMETEKQAPEEEIKLPKKTMNPTEISNLKPEDATTTPNLPEKKYAKGEKTSSFVSNVYNDVGFLNDLQKQDITKDENVRYYKEVTNKKDLENAYKDLQTNGQRATLQWYAKNSKDADSEDVAKGWILLKQYADKGDTQNMINVARKLRDIGTKAGQTVQAFNIMSRLTPEGMVAYTQSELQDAYNEMIKGKTKAWIDQHKADFDLTPEEVAFIMDTMQNLPAENLETHNYERKVALGQIQKLFTDKLPVEKGKIKAWMRISMLFNPKTQVRNVMGNSVVVPVNMFSDFLGSKVDKLLSKFTGVRTLGNTNIKNYLGGMKEGFYQSYNDYKLGINTRDIEQNRFEFGQGKAFKDTGLGKQINRIDNMLNFVMDFGDRGFYQGSFVNSLNNQMLLNGVDTPTQDMIDIATQEALSRTWNDSNDYTKLVLDIRRALNKIGGENYGLGDVLIPFAKTPANLTKAIVEYSPVGLAKSIMDIKGIKNAIETGQFTAQQQHEFVDHLGKGLAGSLLYVISYALAKAGIASGEPDDDKDVRNFIRYSLGISPYSITIGNKSFTYDWMQPIATPLAIMSNLMQYEKNNPDASAIEKVLSSVNIGSNQLLEQSFMQSINEVLNGNGEFTDRLAKSVLDLPARAVPTFFKQVADLVDDTQRTTFEKGKPVQSAVNAVVAKIPVASKNLTPSVDTLGHEIKKYGGDNNFFNVFFNPANINKGQETKAGKEIYDIYMKTGDTTVFPVTAPYYVDRKEGRINMDAETRTKYQRVAGKYTEEAVNKLLSDSSYKALSPDDKAEILSKVVTDSSEKAKKDVLNIDKNGSDLKLIEKVGTDYYTYKISTKGMSKDAELSDVLLNKNYSNKNKQLIYESEINKEDKTFNGLKNIDSNFDMDEYLKYKTQTFSGDNRKEDMVTYINDLNLSRAEQLYIKGRNYKLSNSEKYELESLLEDNPNLEEILDTIK